MRMARRVSHSIRTATIIASAMVGGLALATTGAPAQGASDVVPPARCYLDAVEAADALALAACFAPDGAVVDVRRRIEGREAIEAWAAREVIGGALEVIEVEPAEGGQRLLVHWAPRGSDGWRAHYTFTVRNGAIVVADLQYA